MKKIGWNKENNWEKIANSFFSKLMNDKILQIEISQWTPKQRKLKCIHPRHTPMELQKTCSLKDCRVVTRKERLDVPYGEWLCSSRANCSLATIKTKACTDRKQHCIYQNWHLKTKNIFFKEKQINEGRGGERKGGDKNVVDKDRNKNGL